MTNKNKYPNFLSFLPFLFILSFSSACGFQSVHKLDNQDGIKIDTVSFTELPAIGYKFKDKLINSLEKDDNKYSLNVILEQEQEAISIRQNRVVERYKINVSADYKLYQNGKEIFNDTITRQAGFDLPTSEFAILTAEEDITEKLALEIADEIKMNLILR